jgi:transcriptional regulator with XRE-family HTH domain
VRELPQLKPVREDQGWSQRTLAAKSGVAQRTISELERGERKAMPSTVRKLAEALGVGPQVLQADSSWSSFEIAMPKEDRVTAELPPELREKMKQIAREEIAHELKRSRSEQERVAADRPRSIHRVASREVAKEKDPEQEEQYKAIQHSRQIEEDLYQEQKKWEETGRWAEYYISGNAVSGALAVWKTQHRIFADIGPEPLPLTEEEEAEAEAAFRSEVEERYLPPNNISVLNEYPEDIGVARSRLLSNDPNETIEAAQLVLRRARRIVEEFDSKLQSFHGIPAHYYEDPAANSRIQKLQKALSEQRTEAARAVQELRDIYSEALDLLEDQIHGMRKESDVLEEFVTQAHDSER